MKFMFHLSQASSGVQHSDSEVQTAKCITRHVYDVQNVATYAAGKLRVDRDQDRDHAHI